METEPILAGARGEKHERDAALVSSMREERLVSSPGEAQKLASFIWPRKTMNFLSRSSSKHCLIP
jgi:hypothetical protein